MAIQSSQTLVRKYVLIITTLFCTNGFAQNVALQVYVQQTIDAIANKEQTLDNTFKSYNSLQRYADSVFKTMQRNGYLESIYTIKKVNDTLYRQTIVKQRQQRYLKLLINEQHLLSETSLGSSLSRKRNAVTLLTRNIDSVLENTHRELVDAGQLFNKMYLTQIDTRDNDTIIATLKIGTDTERTLDRIIITGYENFPENIARHLAPRKSPVNKKTLDLLQSNLEAIQFATETKSPEFLFKKDSTLLYIYLTKISNNSAEGFLGFNNASGKTNLTGNIDLRLLNNLNRGEQLALKYRADDNRQRLIESTLDIPYLFNTKLGATASINLLRRDTLFQNNNFKAGIFYSPKWNSSIGINYIVKNSIATAVIPETISDLSSNGIEVSYFYERNSKNKLRPTNTRVKLNLGYASRSIKQQQNANQYIFAVQGTKQWDILSKTSIYISGTSRVLVSDNIQFNELYQLGGEHTIRGFRENSIDSNTFVTVQTELRQDLGSNFYGYTILDAGQFMDFNHKKPTNLYALGAGIGILTQSGVLRVSIANGSLNGLNIDISNIIAHIKFTVLF
jgi:ribosomal protein S8